MLSLDYTKLKGADITFLWKAVKAKRYDEHRNRKKTS